MDFSSRTLGDGTTNERHTPVQVVGPGGVGFLTDVVAIGAGQRHSLAVALANTPAGSNVAVQPFDATTGTSPVTVTFSNVTQPGITSLSTSSTGPTPPSAFQLTTPPIYFELSTTALYRAPVTVCITSSGITGTTVISHYENNTWVPLPTTVTGTTACATVSSFSTFALFEPMPVPVLGRMHGEGHVDQAGKRHQFEFQVVERVSGEERGRLHYSVRTHRPGRDFDEGGRPNRFVATAISFVAFADDATITPGRGSRPSVDTVTFGGIGRWNGAAGYTFVAKATDAGEPGRGRDTFSITIRAPGGNVVATVTGTLSGGNIQSLRIRR